jgi:hypothetical protein
MKIIEILSQISGIYSEVMKSLLYIPKMNLAFLFEYSI